MSGMTLTEFLLARIAEDEVAARDEQIRLERWPAPEGSAYAVTLVDYFTPARVLAECEAKRRVVELAEQGPSTPDRDEHAYVDGLVAAVMLLALPYVDHPDYREEWKP